MKVAPPPPVGQATALVAWGFGRGVKRGWRVPVSAAQAKRGAGTLMSHARSPRPMESTYRSTVGGEGSLGAYVHCVAQ